MTAISTDLPGHQSRSKLIDHRVVWEYWNGRRWAPLDIDTWAPSDVDSADATTGPADLTGNGIVSFSVPEDMKATGVNDEDARWIRVRLASGTFGFVQEVTWSGNGTTNTFSYPIVKPPALGDLRIGYSWRNGPHPAEKVMTFNDFIYRDQTEVARWPGTTFRPFEPPTDATQTLFLGFDRKLPVDRLTLFFDLVEEPATTTAPELIWEYWAGLDWRPMVVEDETRNLSHPGIVSFVGPSDAQALDRFGEELYWLRTRVKAVGLPFSPEVRRIHTERGMGDPAADDRQRDARPQLGSARTGLRSAPFPGAGG